MSDNAPTPELVALLPLPEAIKEICVVGPHCAELRETLEDYYDANEMEEYARACIAATRAATVPQGVSEDAVVGFVDSNDLQGYTLGQYSGVEIHHDRRPGDVTVYRTVAKGAATAWNQISDKDWQAIVMNMPLGDSPREIGYQEALAAVGRHLNSDAAHRPAWEVDANRWREVSNKAWFVDAAGYAYGLREGSFAPTCDEDDVIAAIDAAMTPTAQSGPSAEAASA